MLTVLVAPQLHADICPALPTTPPLCLYLHTHYLHTLSLAAYMLSLSPSKKTTWRTLYWKNRTRNPNCFTPRSNKRDQIHDFKGSKASYRKNIPSGYVCFRLQIGFWRRKRTKGCSQGGRRYHVKAAATNCLLDLCTQWNRLYSTLGIEFKDFDSLRENCTVCTSWQVHNVNRVP